MQLPKAPTNIPGSHYLNTLVRALEQELDARVAKSPRDGVVYLGGEQPVRLISPNGRLYELTINDAGDLITGEVL